MAIISKATILGWLDFASDDVISQVSNLLESFFHKAEGKIVKSISELDGYTTITFSDDTTQTFAKKEIIDIIIAGQVSGYIARKNKADLPAVGDADTAYLVLDDAVSADNNGTWGWDGNPDYYQADDIISRIKDELGASSVDDPDTSQFAPVGMVKAEQQARIAAELLKADKTEVVESIKNQSRINYFPDHFWKTDDYLIATASSSGLVGGILADVTRSDNGSITFDDTFSSYKIYLDDLSNYPIGFRKVNLNFNFTADTAGTYRFIVRNDFTDFKKYKDISITFLENETKQISLYSEFNEDTIDGFDVKLTSAPDGSLRTIGKVMLQLNEDENQDIDNLSDFFVTKENLNSSEALRVSEDARILQESKDYIDAKILEINPEEEVLTVDDLFLGTDNSVNGILSFEITDASGLDVSDRYYLLLLTLTTSGNLTLKISNIDDVIVFDCSIISYSVPTESPDRQDDTIVFTDTSGPSLATGSIELHINWDVIEYKTSSGATMVTRELNNAYIFPLEEETSALSAYEIAVKNGFIGTEYEWLESLKGDDGIDGIAIDSTTLTNIYPDSNFEEDGSDYFFGNGNDDFETGTVTVNTSGIHFSITNYQSGFLEIGRYGINKQPSTRYILSFTYVVGENTMPEQVMDGVFRLNAYFSGESGSKFYTSGDVVRPQYEGRTFTDAMIIDLDETVVADTNARIFIRSGFIDSIGKDVELTITAISLFATEIPVNNIKSTDFYKALIKKQLTKDEYVLPKVSEFSLHHNNIYYGRKLITWGASTTQNCVWQPVIAEYFGMDFSQELTQIGVDSFTNTAKGGSYLVPIALDSDTKGTGTSSYVTLQNAFKYYDDLYTTKWGKPLHIFFIGHNEASSGSSYTSESTFTVPTDYGLNDVAYTGSEIDMVAIPSESILPSFGSAYRGILEYCFGQSKDADIMLMNLYHTAAADTTHLNGINAVIEQVAFDYKLQVLDVTRLWNDINEDFYLDDVIHQNSEGGKKQGQRAISQM